ncbi:ABC transporter substrate-binding protein [Burkholderia pyrrocinia]|uniref:ABC transporter substrate-binding protein n=1 Tax=Burkholderia pyrrocinia TaxID=60550 RepID=A0A2Z5MT79_BURPY|nr:sugar ABC transporter substrate-binding protein [Burkholderia pyrrocinia]AXF20402.1 ABC transporter substrate-binding protein [Burkholderia pyrrocinia]
MSTKFLKFVGVIFASGAALANPPASAAETPKVGYSAGFLTDPFQSVLVQGILEQSKGTGLGVLPAANANGDAAKQITDVRNLVTAGANLLIVNPTDSRAIVPALNFAQEKNVPVIAVDAAPAGGKVYMIVRADNIKMGQQACEAMGQALNGKGKVLSLMGDQATTNGRDRTVGFDDCMKKNYPNVKVIEQPTNWKPEKAASIAQTVLTSNPDLNGIYLQSDSVMLEGVLSVLKSAGKLVPKGVPKHIALVTIDGTQTALKNIRQKYVDVAISQPLNLYIRHAVYFAHQALNAPDGDHAEIKANVVALGSNKMDLIPATVVDEKNVNDASLWGNSKK